MMTRASTAILLAFQRLGLQFVGDNQFSGALDQLPQRGQQWLDANAKKIQEFTARKKFADYVFLGQGAHYWLAQEAGLKGAERSSSYGQGYTSLEFFQDTRAV